MVTSLGFRQKPLLMPPPASEEGRITQSDREAILRELDEMPSTPNRVNLVGQCFFAFKLGVIDGVRDKDMPVVAEGVTISRSSNDGWSIGWKLSMIRGLGIPGYDLLDDEKKYIMERLDKERLDKSGWGVAAMHCFMRNLGIGTRLTDEDEKNIREGLKKIRSEYEGNNKILNGFRAAQMHFWMRQLGIGEGITLEDADAMKNNLADARGSGNGWGIAEMSYLLREIMPETENEGMGELPPLKRI